MLVHVSLYHTRQIPSQYKPKYGYNRVVPNLSQFCLNSVSLVPNWFQNLGFMNSLYQNTIFQIWWYIRTCHFSTPPNQNVSSTFSCFKPISNTRNKSVSLCYLKSGRCYNFVQQYLLFHDADS